MAAQRYSDLLRRHEKGHVLYLELGKHLERDHDLHHTTEKEQKAI